MIGLGSQLLQAMVGSANAPAAPAAETRLQSRELNPFQGRWMARAGRDGGIAVELDVEGDRATFRIKTPEGVNLTATGSMQLHSGSTPASLDWVGFRIGHGLRLPTIPSIYRCGRDTFTVCSGGPNGSRPTDFIRGDGPLADVVTFRKIVNLPGGSPEQTAASAGTDLSSPTELRKIR